MSLKKCKDCGAEISSSAKACIKCGKEQGNFIKKHPVISAIIIIWIIGFLMYITSPKPSNKVVVTKQRDEVVNAENETIEIGDILTGKDWEISIESVDFSQKVEPPIKELYYQYYQVEDSSNTYLYLIMNCKNISTLDLGASSVASVNVKYNNKYTYSSFSTVPDDTLGFTYTSITNIKPLTSKKIYFLAEMPKSISEEKDTPMEINIKFENNVYKFKYR